MTQRQRLDFLTDLFMLDRTDSIDSDLDLGLPWVTQPDRIIVIMWLNGVLMFQGKSYFTRRHELQRLSVERARQPEMFTLITSH